MEEENDEEDITSFNILFSDEDNEEKARMNGQHTEHIDGKTIVQKGAAKQQLLQQHSLRSIESTPLTSTLSVFSVDANRRPLNILELGSGTGIVGIVAAITLGANVTATDLPHVVPNIQFNANANAGVLASDGGVVNVAPLRWGHADDVEVIGRDFDLILASDVVYHDHLYEPLLQTLSMLLLGDRRKKTMFVMAHLRRWKKESVFFKKARKLFNVDVLHLDNPCEGSRVGVVVYRFVGKG
ncbi:hypothetical protein K1719_029219 [Acacia pycnantha]|nr:hypothetical protein K1719_029219 [Acacia pycnantha]